MNTTLRSFSGRRPASRPLAALLAASFLLPVAALHAEQVLRYDGSGHDDHGYALASSPGAFYVGGNSRANGEATQFVVVKYSSTTGARLWSTHYRGPAEQVFGTAQGLATDAAGNLYAVGGIARQIDFLTINYDWLVVSFTASGAQRWAHVIRSADNTVHEQARRCVVDPVANVLYVAGAGGPQGNAEWIVAKYSLDGALLWQRTLGGAQPGDDVPLALQLDLSGNLHVLGWTSNRGIALEKDSTIAKYAPNGTVLWERTFTDGAIGDEFPGGLAVDFDGSVYTTGITVQGLSPEVPNVPYTLKYDAAGNQVFHLRGETAGGASVAANGDGTFVVAGTFIGDAGGALRSSISKYTTAGALVWSVPALGDGTLVVNYDDTIFYGGSRFGPNGHDFHAARLTPAGVKTWERTVVDGGLARGALLDHNANWIVTGDSDGFPTDLFTVRYPENFTPPTTPVLPAAPSALALAAAKNRLTLNWSDNSSNESGFLVERAVNGGAFTQIAQTGVNTRSYTDNGVQKNRTYQYRIRAFNAAGTSAYSNTATGSPR